MRSVRIQSLKNQQVIADTCIVAKSFWSQFLGLMGRRNLAQGEGLWLPDCNNIHMWFMRIPIDVLFLQPLPEKGSKDQWTISSLHADVRPWKVFPLADFKATDTIELPSGSIQQHALAPGDILCIS